MFMFVLSFYLYSMAVKDGCSLLKHWSHQIVRFKIRRICKNLVFARSVLGFSTIIRLIYAVIINVHAHRDRNRSGAIVPFILQKSVKYLNAHAAQSSIMLCAG